MSGNHFPTSKSNEKMSVVMRINLEKKLFEENFENVLDKTYR